MSSQLLCRHSRYVVAVAMSSQLLRRRSALSQSLERYLQKPFLAICQRNVDMSTTASNRRCRSPVPPQDDGTGRRQRRPVTSTAHVPYGIYDGLYPTFAGAAEIRRGRICFTACVSRLITVAWEVEWEAGVCARTVLTSVSYISAGVRAIVIFLTTYDINNAIPRESFCFSPSAHR